LENLALRQQLLTLHAKRPRRRLGVRRQKHIRLQAQMNQCISGGSTAMQITLSGR
jgi:hypothetical protein